LGLDENGEPSLAFSNDQSVGRCVLGSTSLEHKKTGMVKKRSVSSLVLFDKLQATGPVIVEHIVVTDHIKKIRQLAEANDDIREMAVDRIRVLCENIMREAYLRKIGSRMPVGGGTATAMIPFFAKVPSVTPAMVSDIQDTLKWSSPAHHTLPGYIVPSAPNIRPHIERLQSIINELGLKK